MDQYETIQMIGEGSFGKVFLAKRKEDNQQCVIKEISLTKLPRKEKESSQKEVILLARLKHPNIVDFYTSFQGFDSEGDATDNRKCWRDSAPQTLLSLLEKADVTSVCPTMEEVDQGIMLPEIRRKWTQESPGMLMNMLAEAECSDDTLCQDEELRKTENLQLCPKNDDIDAELGFGVEVDEDRFDPRSDDDDTNFEESEDELRDQLVESLEKVVTSSEEEILKTSEESTGADQPGKKENTTNSELNKPNESLESGAQVAGDKQGVIS